MAYQPRFWTVTGDKVSAMTMADADGGGEEQLLVGSDDFEVGVRRTERPATAVRYRAQYNRHLVPMYAKVCFRSILRGCAGRIPYAEPAIVPSEKGSSFTRNMGLSSLE